MKPTTNTIQLNLDHNDKPLAVNELSSGVKSARPMKSMVKVKSIRPQRVGQRAGLRGRINGNLNKRVVEL